MHELAKHLIETFNKHIYNIGKTNEFGSSFKYNSIFLGLLEDKEDKEFVVVEEFNSGVFKKYVNNDGTLVNGEAGDLELKLKAECLCHYTYTRSEEKLLLLDIQGAGFVLFDPEIATSADAFSDGSLKFYLGNLSSNAIDMFYHMSCI